MSRSRFMVIKAKDLLKALLFAVAGVVLILALVYFFTGRGNETALYEAGVYTASIPVSDENLEVQVTVTTTDIKEVALIHTSETLPVFYPLFSSTMDELAEQIVREQSVEIELPAEASVTGQLLLDAVAVALGEAALD